MGKAGLSDFELIDAIRRSGQTRESAIRQIYDDQAMRQSIRAYVLSNRGNTHDAEDIFQDAIVLLDQKIRNFDFRGESAISTYLYGIGKNLWRNRERKMARVDLSNQPVDKNKATTDDPESLLIAGEQKAYVNAIMHLVGDRCRRVLELWRLSFSMEEIATTLGFSSAAMAKKAKYRCLKQLKEALVSLQNLNDDI